MLIICLYGLHVEVIMFWIYWVKENILKLMSPVFFVFFKCGYHKILNPISASHDVNTEQQWRVGLAQKVPCHRAQGSCQFTL